LFEDWKRCSYRSSLSTEQRNSSELVMQSCLRSTHLVQRFVYHSSSWRMARMVCAVWFALTSIGLPASFSLISGTGCARNPGSQCRCSITKRMSGSCCCRREAEPQDVKSCCSVKKSAPKLAEPKPSTCCSTEKPKVEDSVSRCDCGSDSPAGMSAFQEPRLPTPATLISFMEIDVPFFALPAKWDESALLLPPVPPPKVVL